MAEQGETQAAKRRNTAQAEPSTEDSDDEDLPEKDQDFWKQLNSTLRTMFDDADKNNVLLFKATDKTSDERFSTLDQRTNAQFTGLRSELQVMNGKIEASAAVGSQALTLAQEAMQKINALTDEVKQMKSANATVATVENDHTIVAHLRDRHQYLHHDRQQGRRRTIALQHVHQHVHQ